MDSRDLFNSFFVSPNPGGSHLSFDELEQLKASIIYPVVFAEVSRRTLVDVQTEPVEKFEATKNNLEKIWDLFKEVDKDRNEFISNYPKWCRIRERSIQKLRKIGKSLHKDKLRSNVSKIVGSTLGVVGGAAMITSLLVSPGSAASQSLSLGGSGASLVGGGVVFGTSVTKYGLLKKKMKKAKKILLYDQEAYQVIAKWFKHTMALKEAIEAVVGFQLMKTLAKELEGFTKDFRSEKATYIRKGLHKILGLVLDTDNNFVASCGIHLASIILTFCVVVIVSPHGNSGILDCVIITNCMVLGALTGLGLGVEVGRGVTMAVRGGAAAADISAEAAKAVCHGVFGGIGLTLSAINLVLISIDVHKGSWSKHGIKILNAADTMNDELEFFKKLYDGLEHPTIVPTEISPRNENRNDESMNNLLKSLGI